MQDPRNLGACLRTADGAGVDLVVLPNDRAAELLKWSAVAAGAAENLSLARVRNLSVIWKNYLSVVSDCSVQVISQEIYIPIIDDGSIRIGYGCGRY